MEMSLERKHTKTPSRNANEDDDQYGTLGVSLRGPQISRAPSFLAVVVLVVVGTFRGPLLKGSGRS